MSTLTGENIKRWAARRKTALVLEIIQGKTSIAEASRAYDLSPSEVEAWVEDGKTGMENALRANPQDVREQYEREFKELREAYGETMLELRARKSSSPAGRGREVIETIRQGLKDDGFDVLFSKQCRPPGPPRQPTARGKRFSAVVQRANPPRSSRGLTVLRIRVRGPGRW